MFYTESELQLWIIEGHSYLRSSLGSLLTITRVWFYGFRIRKFIYIRQKIVYRNDVNISQFISRITDTDLFLI